MSAMSNFLENALADLLMRGQSATINGKTLSWSATPTYYVALYTTDPTDAGGGTEVSGTGYARVALACSLANWSGTQSVGSTTASSGTAGRVSNNATIDFGTAGGSWGTVTHMAIHDASSGGNLLIHKQLASSRTITLGDPVTFPADSLGLTFA
jgi:hypothetical protein